MRQSVGNYNGSNRAIICYDKGEDCFKPDLGTIWRIKVFQLQFDEKDVQGWADKYDVAYDTEAEAIGAEARKRGYYTHAELLAMGKWSTTRTQKLLAENEEALVVRHTRTALSTYNEGLRLEVLTSLRGVAYPTATLLLHFGFDNRYPLLNGPSLWSLGYEDAPAAYTLEFWLEYVDFCRELAEQQGVTLRVLDRALWQYAHEHQTPTRKSAMADITHTL